MSNLNRRKFIQLSALASAATTFGCKDTSFTPKQEELSAVGKGWTPRKLKKKPNILFVVLDDVGFGDLGCFGAEHRTSCMDSLAATGTRLNNFNVTALCAPTRGLSFDR